MIAQLPNSTMADLGTWIVGCCGVLCVYWLARQVYLSHFPVVPKQEDLYVTHAQFDLFKIEYRRELSELRADIRRDMEKSTAEAKKDLGALDGYVRDAFHRAATGQQTLMNDLAFIKGTMAARKAAVPDDPL